MSGDPLLTDTLIAERLGMSLDELRRRCRQGEFAYVKLGRKYRFTEAHYQAIVDAHSRDAKVTVSNPWGVRRRGRAAS